MNLQGCVSDNSEKIPNETLLTESISLTLLNEVPENGLTIIENNNLTLSFAYDYEGDNAVTLSTSNSNGLLTAEVTGKEISISALEVNSNQSDTLSVTVNAGDLSDTLSLNIEVVDEATNYEFNHKNQLQRVRGNIEEIEFILDIEVDEQLDTANQDALKVSFINGTTYFASLTDLTVSNLDTNYINVDENTIIGINEGTTSLDLNAINYAGSVDVNVISNETNVSGQLTFERLNVVDFGSTELILDADNPVQTPLANIYTYLIDLDGEVIKTTITNSEGKYQFVLDDSYVSKNYHVQFEAKSLISGDINSGFEVQVKDQSSADVLTEQRSYYQNSEPFVISKGNNSMDMHLLSGWDTESRSFPYDMVNAQPFAILDTINKVAHFLSEKNRPIPRDAEDLFINWTKHPEHLVFNPAYYNHRDNLIVLNGTLGEFTAIFEWSETTIAHEFGHFYVKKVLGRDDTIGGQHAELTPSGLRIAFSEGFATAIANASLDNWIDYRLQNEDPTIRGQYFDDPMVLNTQGINESYKSETVDFDGISKKRLGQVISAWDERTVAFFILSLIDDKAGDEYFTSNLSSEIGFARFHDIVKEFNNTSSILTLYGLANEVKKQYPQYADKINELGLKINANFVDEWSAGTDSVSSLKITEETPLDPNSYLPLYADVSQGLGANVCFNGGYLGYALRPGIVRYAKFTADKTTGYIVKAPISTDSRGYDHQFRINVLSKGETAPGHNLFKDGLDTTYFEAEAGETYSIVLTDELMFESIQRNYDETYCTNVTSYEYINSND